MDSRSLLVLALAAHLCVLSSADSNFITQTVYGFLDFTTTIGNTVMVFSPQSAPPPEPPSTEPPKPTVQDNVIETKPPPIVNVKPEAIKPSKLNDKDNTKKPAPPVAVASAVSVVTSPPKKEEKPKEQKPIPKIISKVEVVAGPSKIVENKPPKSNKKPEVAVPANVIGSKVEVKQAPVLNTKLSSVIEIKSSVDDEPAILVNNNNIGEPEYDFLSRQPSEFVEETYKVINLRPSKIHAQKPKVQKNRPTPPPPSDDDDEHPLGLVTTLGGTIVKDGLTTVHETSVIGTYISGKYAQVLNSNSKILNPPTNKGKISPSPPHRILKTVAPGLNKNHRHNLEPTPSAIDDTTGIENNHNKNSRRQSNNGGSFKNRHNPRPQNNPEPEHENTNQNKKYKNRNAQPQRKETESPSSFSNRRKNTRNPSFKATVTPSNNENQSRRGFKPRVQPSAVEQVTPAATTSVYKFKLNRTPGSGRWQYKTSPKPKVTIRKMMGDDEPQTTPNPNPLTDDLQSNDVSVQSRVDNDLELQGSHSGPGSLIDNDDEDNSIEKPPPVETIRVEISTPVDFKDVYYEIATLRSPYTFQVGRVKNTRIITVTTTYKKTIQPTQVLNTINTLNEPLTENILATASPYEKDHNLLDGSIATLPPITLNPDQETPPLETFTETFSTTNVMLKTHLLPVVKDNLTDTLTFIQTYHVTRLVTATKTLPPMDYFQFIPSKTLKEFNSRLDEAGSELHLELDFGDSNEEEDGVTRRVFPADLDLANIGSELDLSEVDKSRLPENHLRLKKAHGQSTKNQVTESPTQATPALTPEQAQQLALLRLLNPAAAAQIPDVVTTRHEVLKYETVYETHVIPVFDGKSTVLSTISRPVATITRTEYEIGTSALPAIPLQPLNPLFPQQQQYSLTSTQVVLNTEITATDSQVLKLTFGAKTVYTTLYTTKIVPTVLTTYLTTSVLVQPTAGAFPGFFPGAPFGQFPYVG